MRLCLSCYRLWPAGSVFCGHCGRSFGGRLCPKRHLSPASAQVCVHCGRTDLTEPTAALPLGWLFPVLSGGFLFLAGLWLWRHYGCCLLLALYRATLWTVVWAVLLALVPEPFGKPLRRLAGRLLRLAWALVKLLLGIRADRKE